MAPKKKQSTKKKGGKKKKKTEKESLESQADLFIQKSELHVMFIERIGCWLLRNFARVIDIFCQFDKNGDGLLTYEEFFAGMTDLQSPCNKLELMVLAKTVDENKDGMIDYTEFSQGIKYRRPVKVFKDDGFPVLKIAREAYEQCPHCSIKIWKPKDIDTKFVSLSIKLHSMKHVQSYVGHINCVVHAHITVTGIINVIRERYSLSLKNITVFQIKDSSRILLDGKYTLNNLGFNGGPEDNPEELTLFYEFETHEIQCPILQVDHYFDR